MIRKLIRMNNRNMLLHEQRLFSCSRSAGSECPSQARLRV